MDAPSRDPAIHPHHSQELPTVTDSWQQTGYPEEAAANVPYSCEFLWDEWRVTESTVAVVSPLAGDQSNGASDEPEVMSGSSSIRDENFSTNGKPLPSKSGIHPAFFPGELDP